MVSLAERFERNKKMLLELFRIREESMKRVIEVDSSRFRETKDSSSRPSTSSARPSTLSSRLPTSSLRKSEDQNAPDCSHNPRLNNSKIPGTPAGKKPMPNRGKALCRSDASKATIISTRSSSNLKKPTDRRPMKTVRFEDDPTLIPSTPSDHDTASCEPQVAAEKQREGDPRFTAEDEAIREANAEEPICPIRFADVLIYNQGKEVVNLKWQLRNNEREIHDLRQKMQRFEKPTQKNPFARFVSRTFSFTTKEKSPAVSFSDKLKAAKAEDREKMMKREIDRQIMEIAVLKVDLREKKKMDFMKPLLQAKKKLK
uniref:TPX2 domain-containing protein n=1 Tax=Steinernema glaseri TaxID=37863 RepID=A0A1I7ZHZ5_9BILA